MSQRDVLVQQIKDVLDGSANGRSDQLIGDGRSYL